MQDWTPKSGIKNLTYMKFWDLISAKVLKSWLDRKSAKTCTHLCFKWRNPSKAFKRRNLNILKDYLDKIVFMSFEQNSLLEDAKF